MTSTEDSESVAAAIGGGFGGLALNEGNGGRLIESGAGRGALERVAGMTGMAVSPDGTLTVKEKKTMMGPTIGAQGRPEYCPVAG